MVKHWSGRNLFFLSPVTWLVIFWRSTLHGTHDTACISGIPHSHFRGWFIVTSYFSPKNKNQGLDMSRVQTWSRGLCLFPIFFWNGKLMEKLSTRHPKKPHFRERSSGQKGALEIFWAILASHAVQGHSLLICQGILEKRSVCIYGRDESFSPRAQLRGILSIIQRLTKAIVFLWCKFEPALKPLQVSLQCRSGPKLLPQYALQVHESGLVDAGVGRRAKYILAKLPWYQVF